MPCFWSSYRKHFRYTVTFWIFALPCEVMWWDSHFKDENSRLKYSLCNWFEAKYCPEARYQCTFHYLSFLHVKILIRCFPECMFWSGEKEENMTSLEPLGERWICHWWHKTSMYYFDSLVWKLFVFSKVTQKKKGEALLSLGRKNWGEMPPSQSVTPCRWACDLGLTICCHLEIFIWS